MKNLVKYLIFVQAMLTLFVLVGCSSFNTAQKTGGSDAIAEVISAGEIAGDSDIDEKPSSVLAGRSTGRLSAQSNSIWLSRVTVQDLAAQGVWDRAIQGDDKREVKSTSKSHFSQGVRISKGPKVASQRDFTVSVSDALNEVLSGSNTPGRSTAGNASSDIITATEMDESTDEGVLPK
jgi:hypothetical protein